MKIKRITAIVLMLAVLAAAAVIFAGCGGGSDEPMDGLIAIQPIYVGKPVTETNHEFKKSDFKVYAVFTGSQTVTVDDFEFEIKEMNEGYYILTFYYGGQDNELYVPCDINFFPTDRETYGG